MSGVLELGEGCAVGVAAPRRRPGSSLRALAEFVAERADVPVRDVELVSSCPVCGGGHGRPQLEYPTSVSGARWEVDCLTAVDGSTVVAVSERHPIGLGTGTTVPGAWERVEPAAMHPDELAMLDTMPDDERAVARGRLWARKGALMRLIGHAKALEPARIALSVPEFERGEPRVERVPGELGARWRDVRFREFELASGEVLAVALPF
nr:hypothetical protein [Agromyces seonyuensis]